MIRSTVLAYKTAVLRFCSQSYKTSLGYKNEVGKCQGFTHGNFNGCLGFFSLTCQLNCVNCWVICLVHRGFRLVFVLMGVAHLG
jgi:hypothetical protein